MTLYFEFLHITKCFDMNLMLSLAFLIDSEAYNLTIAINSI